MTEDAATGTSAASAGSADSLADPVYLQSLREQMVKFASLQLGDLHLAEDAVQEALIGALRNADSFGARSALKTWVFAILKNKIADQLRRRQRNPELSASALFEDDAGLDALFDVKGFWQRDERPVRWDNPEGAFRQEEFWTVFEVCLDHMPPRQARVFMMREFIELESDEICASLGLSVSNLHVTLHRARLRLRECLEDRWFSVES